MLHNENQPHILPTITTPIRSSPEQLGKRKKHKASKLEKHKLSLSADDLLTHGKSQKTTQNSQNEYTNSVKFQDIIPTQSYPWSNRQRGTPSPRTCSRRALFLGRWTRASTLTGSGWNTLQPAHQWTWQPGRGKGGGVYNPFLKEAGEFLEGWWTSLLPMYGLILGKEKKTEPKLAQKSSKKAALLH